VRSVEIAGVPGVKTRQKAFGPINLLAGEIFKIRGGEIHEIEAMGTLAPYGAASGWEWTAGASPMKTGPRHIGGWSVRNAG
jgi:hypothetical protein